MTLPVYYEIEETYRTDMMYSRFYKTIDRNELSVKTLFAAFPHLTLRIQVEGGWLYTSGWQTTWTRGLPQ